MKGWRKICSCSCISKRCSRLSICAKATNFQHQHNDCCCTAPKRGKVFAHSQSCLIFIRLHVAPGFKWSYWVQMPAECSVCSSRLCNLLVTANWRTLLGCVLSLSLLLCHWTWPSLHTGKHYSWRKGTQTQYLAIVSWIPFIISSPLPSPLPHCYNSPLRVIGSLLVHNCDLAISALPLFLSLFLPSSSLSLTAVTVTPNLTIQENKL